MDQLLESVLFLARYKPTYREPDPELLTQAGKYYPPFDESALEAYFDSHPLIGNTSERKHYIFLPIPSTPRVLPVLNMDYDLEKGEACFQLVMFVEKELATEGLRSFGYRYEAPEGPGRHNYWHAQPILELRECDGKTRDLPGKEDDWIPTCTPAFPLDASEPIDLLICLMISLYGLKQMSEIEDNLKPKLTPHLAKMRALAI